MNSTQRTSVLMVVEQLRRPIPGGIGTYISGLLSGLSRLTEPQAPAVCLYASAPRSRPDPLEQWGLPVTTSPWSHRVAVRLWDRGVDRAPESFSVMHATSLAVPPEAKSRAKRVTMVHDLAWRSHPEATTKRGVLWHERALRRELRRADALVTPSALVAEQLVDLGARMPVAVIPHGVDHLEPPDETGAANLLARLGVRGPFILAVGTVEPRKNLERLVAAHQILRAQGTDVPLVIVGSVGWGHVGIGTGIIPDGVVMAGSVSGAVLSALYDQATVFAFVPLTEGFGLPPIEAMSRGLAVVASTSVPSTWAATAVTERVDPFDIDAIAAGLDRVLHSESRRKELIVIGRAWATTHTWESSARAHVELWRSLA